MSGKKKEQRADTRSEAQKNKDEWRIEKRANTLRFVNVVALMLVFAGIALFMTFGKRPNVSYEENRDLEKPPQFTWEGYWKGEVTEQFAKYYNDTVPMRSTWKLFISNFRDHMGIKYDGGVIIVGPLPVFSDPDEPDDVSRPENSIPAVVIPGQGGETSSSNRIPAVVIPGQTSSDGESSEENNRIPDVVIPE